MLKPRLEAGGGFQKLLLVAGGGGAIGHWWRHTRCMRVILFPATYELGIVVAFSFSILPTTTTTLHPLSSLCVECVEAGSRGIFIGPVHFRFALSSTCGIHHCLELTRTNEDCAMGLVGQGPLFLQALRGSSP